MHAIFETWIGKAGKDNNIKLHGQVNTNKTKSCWILYIYIGMILTLSWDDWATLPCIIAKPVLQLSAQEDACRGQQLASLQHW